MCRCIRGRGRFPVAKGRGRAGGWRAFPDEEALFNLTVWWHEQLGGLAYRVFGGSRLRGDSRGRVPGQGVPVGGGGGVRPLLEIPEEEGDQVTESGLQIDRLEHGLTLARVGKEGAGDQVRQHPGVGDFPEGPEDVLGRAADAAVKGSAGSGCGSARNWRGEGRPLRKRFPTSSRTLPARASTATNRRIRGAAAGWRGPGTGGVGGGV